MTRLLLIATLVWMSLATFGQTKTDSTVVPEIATLDAAWKPVVVHHAIGIRGGWGTGSMRREPARENVGLPFNLWNFGISYRFDVPDQKYVGTITFDLEYVQKGFAYLMLFGGTQAYARRFDVIQLPILWQPYLPLGKGGSRFYLSAGPFVSYTISSVERLYDTGTKEIFYNRPYVMDQLQDFFWNYGITAGAGFNIGIKRFSISVDFRYNIQLSDIIRGPEYIKDNPFRTPVDQMSVSLGLHYTFSIGKQKNNE